MSFQNYIINTSKLLHGNLKDGAEINDIVHFFCTCEAVRNTWSWLKIQVLQVGQTGAVIDDWHMINLLFCQTPDLGQGLEFDFTFAMEQ